MITYTTSTKPLFDQKADAYVLFLQEDFSFDEQLQAIAQEFIPDLEELIKKHAFTGKPHTHFSLHIRKNNETKCLMLFGIGKKPTKKTENYRRALGSLVRLAESHGSKTIALALPEADFFGISSEQLGQETSVIFGMAQYFFDEYLNDKKQKAFDIIICLDENIKAAVEQGLEHGKIIATAVNKARHWIDLPPDSINPDQLADMAKHIAEKNGLKFTDFDEKEVKVMGMGGLTAVAKGSEIGGHLVILEYRTQKEGAPTLAFVGKGITFDSGGLSLKPSQHMENMKDDMSGGAAVIVALEALAQLKPDVNVIGVVPIAENMPSGKATKPGDIVRFYNGVTAEIRNTDAEGRLILADALAYTHKHYAPDAILDIATLTGACAYALGPFFSGLMTQYPELADKIQESADRTGDRVWSLPFDDDYKVAIKSKVADLCNIGNSNYRAGAITAGFFLQPFVGNTPWAHLDIAGTAYDVPDISYLRPGATGAAVRLMIDLARNWK